MSEPVVHIVDDDAPLRESLDFLLTTAGFSTRVYASAPALLAHLDVLEAGIILTDVRMPGMTGLDLVARLEQVGAPHPVIVLTGHADVPLAVAAMKAGVTDFLEKPVADEVLIAAVRAALAQSRDVGARDTERDELRARMGTLTARERDVFDAIVAGESNKGAAQKLGISPRTVEIYRANVMAKMKAQSLSELVRMALRCDMD